MSVNRASSLKELQDFVRDELGIEPGDKTRNQLLELIQGDGKDSGGTTNPPVEPELPEPAKKEGKVKIIIPAQNDKVGSEPVFVAVNAKTYRIVRGEEVEVPLEVIEVLKNAVEARYRQKEDGTLAKHYVTTTPFTIVG